jgi:hypothetical protein
MLPPFLERWWALEDGDELMISKRRMAAMGVSLLIIAGCNKGPGEANKVSVPKAKVEVNAPAKVDPDAVAALRRMSSYLTSLKTAQIESKGSLDVVTNDGQRIQMDGLTNYKLRKPGFVIDFNSDLKKRRFFYDGKTFTEYSPTTGFYATVPAPPTNGEALAAMYKNYGISLPLADLFRWSDPNGTRDDSLTSAYQVGTATLDGVPTDHYAFREGNTDWELWVQQGDQPLPRKLVIVDRSDAARPTFAARLDWKVNPPLGDQDFTFKPGAKDKHIQFAKYQGPGA